MVTDLCSDHPTRDPEWWLAIIGQLPEESAFVAEVRGGPEHRGWTLDRHLQALTLDAINMNTINTGNYRRRPQFEPFPRPGADQKTTRVATLDEALPF